MGSSQSRETHRQEQGAARSGHGQADGTLAAGLWAEPGGWQWSLGSLSPPAHARTQLAPKGANQCGGWRGPGRAGDTEQCTAQLPPPPPPGREISAPHPREGFDLQPPVTLAPLQLGPRGGGRAPTGSLLFNRDPPQPLRIGVSSLGNKGPQTHWLRREVHGLTAPQLRYQWGVSRGKIKRWGAPPFAFSGS